MAMRSLIVLLFVIFSNNVYGELTYTDISTGIIYEVDVDDGYAGNGTILYAGTCRVVGFDEQYIKSSIIIPEEVTLRVPKYVGSSEETLDCEMKVTGISISSGHTLSSSNVTSFIIPNSVSAIGGLKLVCENLSSLTIPGSVTTISSTTINCVNLSSFTIQEGVTSLSNFTLRNNKLESLEFPESILEYSNVNVTMDNLKKIQFGTSGLANVKVFSKIKISSENCTSLIIPDGIDFLAGTEWTSGYTWSTNNTGYGKVLQLNVPELLSVTIPKSLDNCNGFTDGDIAESAPNGPGYVGFFGLYCPKLETVRFKDEVTTIPAAFGCCLNLKNIVWPNKVDKIEDYAFLGCTGLETLKIPKTIKDIGRGAFMGCSGLKDIYVYWEMPVEDDFYDATKWYHIVYTTFGGLPNTGEKFAKINGVYVPTNDMLNPSTYENATLHLVDDNPYDYRTPQKYKYKKTSPWKYFFKKRWHHSSGNSGSHSYLYILDMSVSASGNGKITYEHWTTLNGSSTASENNPVVGNIKEIRNETQTYKLLADALPVEEEITITPDEGASIVSVAVNGRDVTGDVAADGLLTITGITANTNIVVRFSGAEQPKDDVTLTAKSYSRVYGDPNPTFEYTVTNGSITSGSPKITCVATATSPVGTYDIVIEKGSVSNSTVNLVKGTLTITKASLTVSAGNYTKVEGEENPSFKATYTGFKNGETEAALTKKPTIITTATKTSPAGSYPVTVSGAEAQNYDFTYQNGTLTITAKPQESNTFTSKTVEGVEMTFTILNEQKKICMVGVDNTDKTWLNAVTAIDNNTTGKLTIPEKANGYVVEKVGDYAFYGCKISEIVLPEGLAFIGTFAFANCPIATVTLPSTLTFIGSNSFTKLETIYSHIINPFELSEKAFNYINYQVVGSEGTSYYYTADLYVPLGSKSKYANTPTWNLFQVNGDRIFETGSNPEAKAIQFADGNVKAICVANWDKDYDGELSKDEAAAVKDIGTVFRETQIHMFDELQYFTGLTVIGNNAFRKCQMLTSITLPKSIQKIGENAFTDCRELTALDLPASLTEIGQSAFAGCKFLTVTITQGNKMFMAEDMMLYQKDKYGEQIEMLVWCSPMKEGNVTINNTATKLADNCFYDCGNIISVDIPDNVKILGDAVFVKCSNLENVRIGKGVESIGEGCFNATPKLRQITVYASNPYYAFDGGVLIKRQGNVLVAYPNAKGVQYKVREGIEAIGKWAFYYTNIASVTLPETLSSIEDYAFYDCKNLTEIIINTKMVPEVAAKSFGDVTFEQATLTVPAGMKSQYQTAEVWKNFKNIVEMQDTGINGVGVDDKEFKVYDLKGHTIRSEATSLESLPKGVYIINGRTVVK